MEHFFNIRSSKSNKPLVLPLPPRPCTVGMPGIYTYAISDVFRLNQLMENKPKGLTVSVSFFELYGVKVRAVSLDIGAAQRGDNFIMLRTSSKCEYHSIPRRGGMSWKLFHVSLVFRATNMPATLIASINLKEACIHFHCPSPAPPASSPAPALAPPARRWHICL